MRHSLLLAASALAMMAVAAIAQEEPPAETTDQTATEQPAAEQPATEQPAAEGQAPETQVVTTTGDDGAAAAGDPQQALTAAAQQLQDVADRFQGAVPVDATGTVTTDATGDAAGAPATDDAQQMQQEMQGEATEALDQFDEALQQYAQAPEGQEAQDQIASLQQQSEQVRQRLQDDALNAGPDLRSLAQAALQLQTASIPAEADAIVGRQVVTADGEEGGEVRDVLITSDGQVEALLIERGGALGLGGTQVAVPWAQVQLQGDQIMVNMTRDELRNAPEYQTE